MEPGGILTQLSKGSGGAQDSLPVILKTHGTFTSVLKGEFWLTLLESDWENVRLKSMKAFLSLHFLLTSNGKYGSSQLAVPTEVIKVCRTSVEMWIFQLELKSHLQAGVGDGLACRNIFFKKRETERFNIPAELLSEENAHTKIWIHCKGKIMERKKTTQISSS